MNGFIAYKFAHRHGFVALRYVAAAFFLISQLATFLTIAHYMDIAELLMQDVLETKIDLMTVYLHASMFHIEGAWGTILSICRSLGNLVIPLYFVATVAFVLNLRNDALEGMTARNALLAVVFFLIETFVLAAVLLIVSMTVLGICLRLEENYPNFTLIIKTIFQKMNFQVYGVNLSEFGEPEMAVNFIVLRYLVQRLPSFNIFIDLFLCLLICFFLTVRPKWADRKWKLRLFRSFAALPVLYVVAAFIFNGLVHSGTLDVDLTLLTVIPARRIPFFLFFGCILFYHRMAARPPMRVWDGLNVLPRGNRKLFGDGAILETRREGGKRALRMAVFLSVCLFLISAIDFSFGYLDFAAKWGLGKSYYAVFAIPFFFLFDDRKPVSKKQYSAFLAVYCLIVLVIVFLYARYILL